MPFTATNVEPPHVEEQVIYVVLGQGTEYNDETYELHQNAWIHQKGTITKEAAIEIARQKLKDAISDYRCCDFEDWDWHNADYYDQFLAETGKDKWDATFAEYIEWCKQKPLPWWSHVPQLYVVQEVTL